MFGEVRALIEGEQFDRLIDVVIARFSDLQNASWQELHRLLGGIDDDARRRHPELVVLAAAASTTRAPHTLLSRTHVEHAMELMRSAAEADGDPRRLMRSVGLELSAYRVLSRAPEAAAAAARWDRLVDELPPAVILHSLHMVHVLTMQAIAAYVQDARYSDAVQAVTRMHDDVNPWRRLHLESLTAMSHALAGNIVDARAVLARFEETPPSLPWRGHYNAVGWHVASALVAVEDGRADVALSMLDEIDDALLHSDHWPFVLVARARALGLQYPAGEAADIMHELVTAFRGRRASPRAVELVTAATADLLIASGQAERAHTLLGADTSSGPVALAQARSLLRQDPVASRRRATDAMSGPDLTHRLRAEALLIRAIAANRLELHEEASELMSRLATTLERNGGLSVLSLGPRSELLALLPPRHPRLVEYVRALPVGVDGGMRAAARLTDAESKVLRALLTHRSVHTLSETLFISPNTVKTHLRNLYRKLGVGDRAAALAEATRQGLLD